MPRNARGKRAFFGIDRSVNGTAKLTRDECGVFAPKEAIFSTARIPARPPFGPHKIIFLSPRMLFGAEEENAKSVCVWSSDYLLDLEGFLPPTPVDHLTSFPPTLHTS